MHIRHRTTMLEAFGWMCIVMKKIVVVVVWCCVCWVWCVMIRDWMGWISGMVHTKWPCFFWLNIETCIQPKLDLYCKNTPFWGWSIQICCVRKQGKIPQKFNLGWISQTIHPYTEFIQPKIQPYGRGSDQHYIY